MPPTRCLRSWARGCARGVRDAAALAWRFADVAAVHLLDDYERERRPHVDAVIALSVQAGELLDSLASDLVAGRAPRLPAADVHDPLRWSRLPGLDLGRRPFPIGHQVPGPPGLDARLGFDWSWVAADPMFAPPSTDRAVRVIVEPAATYGFDTVLVRPDRYIAEVSGAPSTAARASRH